MRLLLTDAERYPFSAEELATLAPEHELLDVAGHDPEEIAAAAPGVGAIFVYHAAIDAPLVARLRDCRVIVRCGTGYERIDVSAARAAGMEVTYVPDFGSADVATHTLALILACARKLVACDRAMRRGEWPTYPALRPMHRLEGQVLGLLGLGRIARAVARKAAALGMTVVAHDTSSAADDEVPVVPLDELLGCCDVLSVHTPLTEATRGMIDAAALARLRPGAIVVNTSRGGIVDEPALLDALERGHVAAAGLDVFEQEPLPSDHPLLAHPNVVLTPHAAVYTEEALGELRRRALTEATRVLAGQPPRHPVPRN